MANTRSEKTVSEKLFEHFCSTQGIRLTPIPCTDKKTPDYEIELSGRTIVTELKQFDSNESEEACLAIGRSGGDASVWEESGRRVRLKIHQCMKQLKARSNGQLPTLLVLYDNCVLAGTDHTDIKTAMYGDEQVVLTRVGGSAIHVSPIHPGGGRNFTPECGTSISGIALMYSRGTEIHLSLFHNHFAAIPIDPDWFRSEKFRHFALDPTVGNAMYDWRAV